MKLSVILLSLFISFSAQAGFIDPLLTMPVQDAGRLKPFDTFARESLQLLYGKQTYNGREAAEIVMTWLIVPQHWNEQPFVQIRFGKLKEALKLEVERSYFSPKEILSSDRLSLLITELDGKRQSKAQLNPYDQAVQQLENQLGLYHQVTQGNYPRVAPPTEGDRWLAIGELPPPLTEKFQAIAASFVQEIRHNMKMEDEPASVPVRGSLTENVASFMAAAQAQNPALYPDAKLMRTEVHYNHLAPFQKGWMFYLLTALLLGLGLLWPRRALHFAAWSSLIIAFAFHAYGFALRIYLTGRPPVSNMYESVIWVSFGVVLFSIIFTAIFRNRLLLLASTVVAAMCLIVADLAPTILDSSLQPLEPVLRSNFWLVVHVMTITLSYAAFFLAFGLGDIALVHYLMGEKNNSARIKVLAGTIYRIIQVGVVLLAAGTILGGVWADYSWGRFWGWDPKETWAFIALMGYVALLHARIAGWARDLGLIAGSVVSFSLVMMAWYGVNYVLGAGKHSYGFGAGGVQYVASFVALHLAFAAFVVWYVRAARQSA
jgi:cytochrome c-type biogenesis protein CcsB